MIEEYGSFPSSELIGRLATALKVEPKDLFEFYHLQNEKIPKKYKMVYNNYSLHLKSFSCNGVVFKNFSLSLSFAKKSATLSSLTTTTW